MKRTISIILVIVTLVSLFTISSIPASAASSGTYTVTATTEKYYTIFNLGSGKMLNVYGSKNANNTNVTVYSNDRTNGQQWKAVSYNGNYYFVPKCATGRALNVYGSSSKEGSNICLWSQTKSSTQLWKLEYSTSPTGVIIRSVNNPQYVLTANGSSNSSNVCLKKYSAGNAYQVWSSDIFKVTFNRTTTEKETVSSAKYNLVWPTTNRTVTGKYGTHGSTRSNGTRYHSGIDIGSKIGDPCYCVADGVVVMCKSTDDSANSIGGRGRYIVVYHSNGDYSSLYEHLNSCSVKVGDSVKAGQKIGTTGNSGWKAKNVHYDAHLHFGLMNGKMTNTGYDLWTVPGKTYNGKTYTNKTFEPDPAYNSEIKYSYK